MPSRNASPRRLGSVGGSNGFNAAPQASSLGFVASRALQHTDMTIDRNPEIAPNAMPSPFEPHPLRRHRLQRGFSLDQVQNLGIISSQERSITDFENIPVASEDIAKLPTKLRPYYEKLAEIHEHYAEVDTLLSGELPSIIAGSFRPPPLRSIYPSDAAYVNAVEWQRRHTAWHVRPKRMDGDVIIDDEDEAAPADESTPLVGSKQAKRERLAKLALHINTIVNALLVGVKAVAVWYSSSISLMASLIDSALDLLSTFIILGTSWAMGQESDRHLYPAGKRRFEPLGVLIFSVVMICSFVQVFIESFQRVFRHERPETVELSTIGLSTMLATIATKSVLWWWCSTIPSSGVQALAQDAENDVWLNVMSLSFPWLGEKLNSPLLDPIGGMVLSLYIIIAWVRTLFENFSNLSGKQASPDQITRVLYMVTRFNPVLEISDVEVYHIGDDFVCEVDVVLPQSTSLHHAHDVGETIQCMLENLDGVIRAYVHLDYSSSNPQQHTSRWGPTRATVGPVPTGERSPAPSESSLLSGSVTPRATTLLSQGHQRLQSLPDAPSIPEETS
ncbi:Metal tolerance protein 4 [Vanrija pseudolonga]|uniref:Metal tolerance protein 4 n=1 Tax=Vanrija pseudolonga TaxID=143232 RepID=A0AAF0YH00_9TREE|nr:Metal tolerance protein 4 [Vanrija pseudolonga]